MNWEKSIAECKCGNCADCNLDRLTIQVEHLETVITVAVSDINLLEDLSTRLVKALNKAAETLLEGSSPLSMFQPGSEAYKLQAAVDEAHKIIQEGLYPKE